MNTNFVVLYLITLCIFWALSYVVELGIQRYKKKRYARYHFEQTERFRRGFQ